MSLNEEIWHTEQIHPTLQGFRLETRSSTLPTDKLYDHIQSKILYNEAVFIDT